MQQAGSVVSLPQPTTQPTFADSNPQLLTKLFGGDEWDEPTRRAYKWEISDALITLRYCPQCPNISACKMPAPGWQSVYDPEDSKMYRRPMFRAKRCHHFEQREQDRRNKVDPRFSDATFDNYLPETPQEKKIKRICEDYARNLGLATSKGLILAGKPGTGKTHLATAIYRTAVERGFDAAMIPVPELLDELRQSMKGDGPTAIRDKVQGRFLVILDDLGADRVTDWAREELYKLIDRRYRQQYPTIITTNCAPPELEDHIGTRTFDRLCEMADYIAFTGESRRRR